MKKLAIITTHPIQYNAPYFKLLSERNQIEIKVFYTWEQAQKELFDDGFGKKIEWDIPLLEGYQYEFVKNLSTKPGIHHFRGIFNPDLIRKIEEYNADAVLVFGWNFLSHYATMRYFKGKIPVFFRGDSTILNDKKGLRTWLRRFWLKRVYKFVDKAFYVGTNNKDYFLAHGLTESQLVFAPHCVDNQRFKELNPTLRTQIDELRQSCKLPFTSVNLLFAGKLEKKKNPELLVETFNSLSYNDLELIFVGNGVLERKLHKLANNSTKIHFLPFQNQSIMPAVYRLGDIFVLPSIGSNETWGLAVNEAMACGRAILVSDRVGCATDLVRNGENGYIFKADDSNDFIEKLNLMLSNPKNLEKMGKVSSQIIENYSFEKLCQAIETSVNFAVEL